MKNESPRADQSWKVLTEDDPKWRLGCDGDKILMLMARNRKGEGFRTAMGILAPCAAPVMDHLPPVYCD